MDRGIAALCSLLLAGSIVVLTYYLFRHPTMQNWLQLSGVICFGWIIVGGILFVVESRH
jgi:TRAP-type C4-dicarboxylate transport system permease small subunit